MYHPPTNRERIGAEIRKQRTTELFLTQQELADRVIELAAADGVELTLDQSAVSCWETGRTLPALRHRPYVAKALGVPASLLFQQLPEAWVA